MHEETKQTVWISWGLALLGAGIGFVFGGPYAGVVAIAIGTYFVLRGHFPKQIGSRRGLVVTFVLFSVFIVGLVTRFYIARNSPELPPRAAPYMTSWGTTSRDGAEFTYGKLTKGAATSDVEVNGDLLAAYARNYKIVAVCFHWNGSRAYLDTEGLSKSKPYNIAKSSVLITIPWRDSFIREMENQKGTTYALLLVPVGLSPDKFETLRDATQQGAYVLQASSGPP